MADYVISGESRQAKGKGAARKLRAAGKIPAVVYGTGIEAQSIALNTKEVTKIVDSGAQGHLIELKAGQENFTVLLKDVSRDPLRGELIHVDFHKVALDKKLQTTVPVAVIGEGTRENDGGVLVHGARELDIECLPTQIPEHIEVDISGLVIGATVRAADLQMPEGVALASDGETVVVSITAPTKAVETEAEEAAEEAEAAAEPEAAEGAEGGE